MGSPSRARPSGGFSLVELLVAMALLAVILVLVFNGLHTGIRVWERLDVRADAAEQMRTSQRFIRQRLEEARSIDHAPPGGTAGASFSGEAHSMTFIAPLPGHSGAGGLYRFRVFAEAFDDATRLLVEYEVYTPDQAAALEGGDQERVALQDHVADVEFSYFGDDMTTGQPGWQRRWIARDTLPQLVRVRLWPGPPVSGAWPELVVAPRGGVYREAPRFDTVDRGIRKRGGGT